MGKIVVIGEASEYMGKCEYCGAYDELRPYGKNGAKICFDCGMDDKETTDSMFLSQFDDDDDIVN